MTNFTRSIILATAVMCASSVNLDVHGLMLSKRSWGLLLNNRQKAAKAKRQRVEAEVARRASLEQAEAEKFRESLVARRESLLELRAQEQVQRVQNLRAQGVIADADSAPTPTDEGLSTQSIDSGVLCTTSASQEQEPRLACDEESSEHHSRVQKSRGALKPHPARLRKPLPQGTSRASVEDGIFKSMADSMRDVTNLLPKKGNGNLGLAHDLAASAKKLSC